MKQMRNLIGGLLLMATAFVLVNCEQKSSTGPGPSGPSGPVGNISLTAQNQQLFSVPGTNVSTTITAIVTDTAGTAIPYVAVRFTTPAIGSITSTLDSTDIDGKVSVTFNSLGQFGLANITASVTLSGVTKTGTTTIGVYPLTGLASSINVFLSPSILYLADGTDDSVKATIRVFDSLGVGIPGIHVNLATTLGVISFVDTTNNSGTVVTYLHTNQQFGIGLVTASVYTSLPDTADGFIGDDPVTWPSLKTGDVLVSGLGVKKGSTPSIPPTPDNVYVISDVDTFWVFPIDQQLNNLIVSAYPSVLSVPADTIGSSLITAAVYDPNNVGIPGVPISFATNLGLLNSSSGVTDSTGRKSVYYTSLPNTYGIAKVWAVIGNLSDTCTVNVSPTASSNGSLILVTDTNIIYADNGITTANLTALLKDASNQAIRDASIIFTSDYGTINSPVLTDSTGQARAVFQDIGTQSFPDSATIIAKYTPLNIADTVHVMIAPRRTVDHIVLYAASNSLTANGTDSTKVDATVYLENNALAPAGTTVNFLLGGNNIGSYTAPFAPVTSAGKASVYYRAGSGVGVDSLFAMSEGMYSNPFIIQLHAGPPNNIDLTATPSTLPVNSLNVSLIEATIKDTTGNLVGDGLGVLFETTLGSLNPLQALTVNGVATSYLSPSTNAGNAWVKARINNITDSILVSIVPSTPSQIGLGADTTFIQVFGTGGIYQTQIRAYVRDAAGNLVSSDVMVHFRIQNNGFPGGGVNINNHGIEDSTHTSAGVATVALNAGTNSGPVTIKAWTFNNEGAEISAQASLVTIVAGPPSFINVEPPASTAEIRNGGGDVWQVQVSALVLDQYGNQVVDSTAVHFYVIPETTAQIVGEAWTGNPNWNNTGYHGIAFTTLSYHSPSTFDTVGIYAYCMVDEDSVIGSTQYRLPLAGGTLSLIVTPIAWNFDHPPYGHTTTEPAQMECITLLVDDHGIAINNATIVFTSTKGNFNYYSNGPAQYWTDRKVTGPGGFPGEPYDPTGYATLWLITTRQQAFPDPGAIENTAQVTCRVLEYPEITSQPITVTFTQDAD